MKRLTTLLLGLSLAVLPMMAQIGDDVDWSFAFVDEEAEIIEDGATVVRNVVEAYDEVSDVIYSGLSVMKLEAQPNDYLKMHYVIEKIDNGAFQICFPIQFLYQVPFLFQSVLTHEIIPFCLFSR